MFKFSVLLSAFLIAGCAAWFSVTGIAQLFMGAPIAAIAMAISLEFGKLVSVSYTYRYWETASKFLRTYMVAGAVVLSIITSLGIYGFLSSAYSLSAVDFNSKLAEVAVVETQQKSIQFRIDQNNTRLTQLYDIRTAQERRLDELVGRNGFVTQQRVIQSSDKEIENLQTGTLELQRQADSLGNVIQTMTATSTVGSKMGSFKYFADQMGISLDTLVKWFILLIVLVFDPMAVALVLAYNSLVKHGNKKVVEKDKPEEFDLILDEMWTPVQHQPAEPVIVTEDSPAEVAETPTEEPPPPEEESTAPYYMQPDYNWALDSRWVHDPDARNFLTNAEWVDRSKSPKRRGLDR